jgi:glutaminase
MLPAFGVWLVEMGSEPNVVHELLQELHAKYLPLRDGRVADYIPELAKGCPDDFGIVIATASGRVYEVGVTRKPFTIQSISKPFIYGLGLRRLGMDLMTSKIDVEPSGEAFNAISLHPDTGKPRNPMINAGAIAASAQICAAEPEGAEAIMLDFFAELAGRRLEIDHSVYLSEKTTGHRNRAIGHLLRNFNIIETDPEPALDLYFRQCAISVTCRDLAVMAATLACQGRNPFTGSSPLTPEITVKVLALMGTCGMYDFAGQWLVDVGIPAKSGVAGGVMAVIPGRLGIATYSPPLDGFGNSVRGVAVCRELSHSVGLSLFNQYPLLNSTIRHSYRGSQRSSRHWRGSRETAILQAHLDEIRIIHVQGVLDFGGIERLAAELVSLADGVRILILDLARVTEFPVESSGLLERELFQMQQAGLAILLSRTSRLPIVAPEGGGFLQRLPAFDRLDTALQAAEDQLLAWYDPLPPLASSGERPQPMGLDQGFLAELPEAHRQILQARMERRRFSAGDEVIRRGEPGDELFVVHSGLYNIIIDLPSGKGDSRRTRLATFGPGMCFGEIAFIAGRPRSASIVAEHSGECLVLDRGAYDTLCRDQPQVVLALLQAITCDLGSKLAQTSLQLAHMENH